MPVSRKDEIRDRSKVYAPSERNQKEKLDKGYETTVVSGVERVMEDGKAKGCHHCPGCFESFQAAAPGGVCGRSLLRSLGRGRPRRPRQGVSRTGVNAARRQGSRDPWRPRSSTQPAAPDTSREDTNRGWGR